MASSKSYISVIRAFHKLRKERRISSYAADLYFMLVEECNIGMWENPFFIKTKDIEEQLGISRPTICKARKELSAMGLIKFKEGINGNSATEITLCSVNVANTGCKRDLHCKSKEKASSVNVANSSVNVANSSVNVANTDTLFIYKDNKTKLSNDNLSPAVADDGQKKSRKKHKRKRKQSPPRKKKLRLPRRAL